MFVGRGGVIGVAQSGARGLTVLIETEDAPERQAVRDWAAAKKVEVSFLVSGRLGGIGQA